MPNREEVDRFTSMHHTGFDQKNVPVVSHSSKFPIQQKFPM